MTAINEETATGLRPRLHIRGFGSADDADVLLYCFPYAGGNAGFYHPWTAFLPETVGLRAVQLPARQDLLDVPAFDRMEDLAAAVARLVQEDAQGRRYAFLGHSMGALAAFETARELRRLGAALPELLALSGRGAPHLASPLPPLEGLDDDELLATVGEFGGLEPRAATTEALRPLMVPALRADFALLAAHRHTDEPPLACAAAVFGGTDDPLAPDDTLHAWNEHFTGPVLVDQYPGGHFYLAKWASRVVAEVVGRVQPV